MEMTPKTWILRYSQWQHITVDDRLPCSFHSPARSLSTTRGAFEQQSSASKKTEDGPQNRASNQNFGCSSLCRRTFSFQRLLILLHHRRFLLAINPAWSRTACPWPLGTQTCCCCCCVSLDGASYAKVQSLAPSHKLLLALGCRLNSAKRRLRRSREQEQVLELSCVFSVDMCIFLVVARHSSSSLRRSRIKVVKGDLLLALLPPDLCCQQLFVKVRHLQYQFPLIFLRSGEIAI